MDSYPVSIKFAVVTLGAALATLLCFLLMYSLIAGELASSPAPDAVRLSAALSLDEIPEKLEEPKRKRPEKSLPTEPPIEPEGIPIEPSDYNAMAMAMSERPSFDSLADELQEQLRMNLAPPSNDLSPLYVVQPVYPFSAVMKEVEGYVVVNFGVRENGTVRNPVVIESTPGSLFNDAALSAIDKFKFQPRTHLGDPLAVSDIQMRFVFELNEAGAATRITDPGEF